MDRLDSSVGNPSCEEKAAERSFVFSRQSEDDSVVEFVHIFKNDFTLVNSQIRKKLHLYQAMNPPPTPPLFI